MRHVDTISEANFCVSIYDIRSNRLTEEFYFQLDSNVEDDMAYALRYVCNNAPDCITWKNRICMYKVRRGYKVGEF